jgi:hypothetical protein
MNDVSANVVDVFSYDFQHAFMVTSSQAHDFGGYVSAFTGQGVILAHFMHKTAAIDFAGAMESRGLTVSRIGNVTVHVNTAGYRAP